MTDRREGALPAASVGPLPLQGHRLSVAFPLAWCTHPSSGPNQRKQELYFLVSRFAFCCSALGFPKALVGSLFGK